MCVFDLKSGWKSGCVWKVTQFHKITWSERNVSVSTVAESDISFSGHAHTCFWCIFRTVSLWVMLTLTLLNFSYSPMAIPDGRWMSCRRSRAETTDTEPVSASHVGFVRFVDGSTLCLSFADADCRRRRRRFWVGLFVGAISISKSESYSSQGKWHTRKKMNLVNWLIQIQCCFFSSSSIV